MWNTRSTRFVSIFNSINKYFFHLFLSYINNQHHYEDHDDWGSSWKRNTAQQEYNNENFAHRLAYNSAYPGHTGQY